MANFYNKPAYFWPSTGTISPIEPKKIDPFHSQKKETGILMRKEFLWLKLILYYYCNRHIIIIKMSLKIFRGINFTPHFRPKNWSMPKGWFRLFLIGHPLDSIMNIPIFWPDFVALWSKCYLRSKKFPVKSSIFGLTYIRMCVRPII